MKTELLTAFENSKAYMLAVAEAMPEEGYGFKPVEPVWDFGELLCHIAYGIYWWEEHYIKGNEIAWEPPAAKHNKQQIKDDLKERYSGLKRTIAHVEWSDDTVNGFFATLDHITHHRGQAVVYLRCMGIVPPEYRF